MALGTHDLAHLATLALGGRARVAKIAGSLVVGGLIQRLSRNGINLRAMETVCVTRKRSNPIDSRQSKRIVAVTCRAKHWRARNRGLVKARLIGPAHGLQLSQILRNWPTVVMLFQDVQLGVFERIGI